jgi:S-adenosylmethionine:tRNA ribosyltransferase-isomerase
MKVSDLRYDYPEDLVATEPQRPSRVLWVQSGKPMEISFQDLLQKIPSGDVLVINNTKVLKRRVFAADLEILFLGKLNQPTEVWEVLFPAKRFKIGDRVELPLGARMTLKKKGRPQLVEIDRTLDESYFEAIAELPLPPYIQKARNERHNQQSDQSWYQTAWAKKDGSFASPTASLHFSSQDIEFLRRKGVRICELTLHVGLGTFLPVTAEDLKDHDMHEEWVEVPEATWSAVQSARAEGCAVWSLGTTSTRALESAGQGLLKKGESGWIGMTKLLIQPGYDWKVVDRLLTNFHQPESTLLALVAGFSNLETVKEVYQFAVAHRFRLFSYGDLSVWLR